MKTTNDLFYTYIHLYPGFADRIMAGIYEGQQEAETKHLTGKEYMDHIEGCILDKVDP